jgi:hypothetical protein
MSSVYDGLFENGKSYSVTQIMGKFRCRDKRPVLAWIDRLEIPTVNGPKGEEVALGDDINLAIAEHAKCRGKRSDE